MMAQSPHYRMDDDKAAEAAILAGVDIEDLLLVCLSDWPQGDEHQAWLDNTPAQDIADWAGPIIAQIDLVACRE